MSAWLFCTMNSIWRDGCARLLTIGFHPLQFAFIKSIWHPSSRVWNRRMRMGGVIFFKKNNHKINIILTSHLEHICIWIKNLACFRLGLAFRHRDKSARHYKHAISFPNGWHGCLVRAVTASPLKTFYIHSSLIHTLIYTTLVFTRDY